MKRAVRSLIRFLGAGLVLLGVALISLAGFNHRVQKPVLWTAVSGGSSTVAGAILVAFSGRLAERFTDDLD